MKRTLFGITLLSVLLLNLSYANGATNSLSGSISLGANYDSNVNRTPDNEIDEWGNTVSGFLSLTRQEENGALSFQYGQTFSYNHRTDESSWEDHRLNFNAWRNLSDRLRFNLHDTFVKTNDLWGDYLSAAATGIPDDQEDDTVDDTTGDNTAQADPTLSDKIGRQKLWSNYFSTSFDYEYARNSLVTLGYSNRILEYDEPGKDNYKYNNPSISMSYWFSPQWNTSLSYNYTDAKFDISENSTGHDVGLNLNYVHSVQDRISGGLNYNEKNYDTLSTVIPVVIRDYYTLGANLGWTHNFSPKKFLTITAGPEYVNRDNGDESTTAFFDIKYTSRFENGSWFIGANGGFDDRSFAGADEGLSEYQQVSTGVSWQAAKDLSASLSANLRTDSFLTSPQESDEKTYSATAGLSYRLSRLFYVSGRYVYSQLDANITADDYVDHRFFLTLGASKELYRW